MAEPANRSSYASERRGWLRARAYCASTRPSAFCCCCAAPCWHRFDEPTSRSTGATPAARCVLSASCVEGDNDGAAGTSTWHLDHGALQRRQVHTIMPEVSRSLAPFLLGLVPLIAASNIACTRSVAVRTVEIKLTLLGTDPDANPYSDVTFKSRLAALLTNATGAAFEIDRIATTSVTYDPTDLVMYGLRTLP